MTVLAASDNWKAILDYITELAGGVNQMDSRYFLVDQVPSDTFQDMFKYSA